MLVLTRKNKQQIRIGQNITITVLQVKGNSIRLGIEAPDEIRVVRGELQMYPTDCTAENRAAHIQQAAQTAQMPYPPVMAKCCERATSTMRPLKKFMPASCSTACVDRLSNQMETLQGS